MSGWLWAYEPRKCDGDYCPRDCDICTKKDIYTIEGTVGFMLNDSSCFNGTDEQKEKVKQIAEDPRFTTDDVAMAIWMCSPRSFEELYEELDECI